jgi:hypothetical protein
VPPPLESSRCATKNAAMENDVWQSKESIHTFLKNIFYIYIENSIGSNSNSLLTKKKTKVKWQKHPWIQGQEKQKNKGSSVITLFNKTKKPKMPFSHVIIFVFKG